MSWRNVREHGLPAVDTWAWWWHPAWANDPDAYPVAMPTSNVTPDHPWLWQPIEPRHVPARPVADPAPALF